MAKTGKCPLFILFIILCWLSACAPYEPPFTHYLTPEMSFTSVQDIAAQYGYDKYRKVAEHKGFSLLNFEKNGGGDNVFLVIDDSNKPVLRTVSFGKIDKEKLINFVEDTLQHRPKG